MKKTSPPSHRGSSYQTSGDETKGGPANGPRDRLKEQANKPKPKPKKKKEGGGGTY